MESALLCFTFLWLSLSNVGKKKEKNPSDFWSQHTWDLTNGSFRMLLRKIREIIFWVNLNCGLGTTRHAVAHRRYWRHPVSGMESPKPWCWWSLYWYRILKLLQYVQPNTHWAFMLKKLRKLSLRKVKVTQNQESAKLWIRCGFLATGLRSFEKRRTSLMHRWTDEFYLRAKVQFCVLSFQYLMASFGALTAH